MKKRSKKLQIKRITSVLLMLLFISTMSLENITIGLANAMQSDIKMRSLAENVIEQEKEIFLREELHECSEEYNNSNYKLDNYYCADIEEEAIPEKYDSRDLGYVSSSRDQSSDDTSAIFSSINANQILYAKTFGEQVEFSEYHMKHGIAKSFLERANPYGYNRLPSQGASQWWMSAYLVNNKGLIGLTDFTSYNAGDTLISSNEIENVQPLAHVTGTLKKSGISNADPIQQQEWIDEIKSIIYKYGACQITMSTQSTAKQNSTYYYIDESKIDTEILHNHSVTAIGWDDNMSAELFASNDGTSRPSSNGGFIIKNSWGPQAGDSGYIYISYEYPYQTNCDVHMSTGIRKLYENEQVHTYSELSQGNTISTSNTLAKWYANKFYLAEKERVILREVNFYAALENQTYNIYLSKTGSVKTSEMVKLGSLTSTYEGYYTFLLDEEIVLGDASESEYVIAIMVDPKDNSYAIPLENSEVDNSIAEYVAYRENGVRRIVANDSYNRALISSKGLTSTVVPTSYIGSGSSPTLTSYVFSNVVVSAIVTPVPGEVEVNISSSKTGTQVQGTSVTWTASATNGSGTKTYTFNLYKNGILQSAESQTGTSATYTKTLSTAGSYYVKCTVSDDSGTASKDSSTITVIQAITLASVSANKTGTQMPNTSVTWTAIALNGTGTKTYKFELYKDGIIQTAETKTSTSAIYTQTLHTAGSYYVKCTVSDDNGTVSKDSAEITIIEVISLTSITANQTGSQVTGTSVTWTAVAENGLGTKVYTFELYKDGVLQSAQTQTGPSATYTKTLSSIGLYYVRCTVNDDSGMVSEDSSSIIITQAIIPVSLTSITANETGTHEAGIAVIWTAVSANGSGSKTYKFELYRDGVLQSSETQTTTSAAYTRTLDSVGSYYVKCTVSDSSGTASKDSAVITVTKAIIPVSITSLIADKTGSHVTGTTVTWIATSESGTGTKTYKFEMYKDEVLQSTETQAGSSATYTRTLDSVGLYYVKCTVSDDRGSASKDSAAITVTQAIVPVSLTNVMADKTGLQVTGTAITWTATAENGLGTKTYTFDLYKDGTKQSTETQTGSSATYTKALGSEGLYHVKCTVSDESGTSTKDSTTITVTPLIYPVSLTTVIANKTGTQTQGVSVTWTATSENGSGIKTYTFDLYKDSTKQSTETQTGSSATYTRTLDSVGSYYVKCTVSDDSGTSSKDSSSITAIQAVIPVSLTSISATESGTSDIDTPVTWTAAAENGKGTKTYTFNLYKDDKKVDTQTGISAAYTKTLTDEGIYYVECTVTDSTGTATKSSETITVVEPIDSIVIEAVIANKSGTQPKNTAVTWTIETSGGNGGKTYAFNIYKNGTRIFTEIRTSASYTRVLSDEGSYYVECMVADLTGTAIKNSETIVIEEGVLAKYKVTFKPENGGTDAEFIGGTGTIVNVPSAPVRANYNFLGWYIRNEKITQSKITIGAEDIIVTARWEKVKYTVTMNYGNGENPTSIEVQAEEIITRPSDPERSGYNFTGWYTDEKCTTEWNFATDKVTSNVTIYAGWEEIVEDTTIFTMRLNSQIGMLNGQELYVDNDVREGKEPATPFTLNGSTMVPVRSMQHLGAVIDYIDTESPITVSYNGIELTLYVGTSKIVKTVGTKTETISIDVAPTFVDGKTYLPFRALCEALGFSVEYINTSAMQNIIGEDVVMHLIIVSSNELTEEELKSEAKVAHQILPYNIKGISSITSKTPVYNIRVGERVRYSFDDLNVVLSNQGSGTEAGCKYLFYSSSDPEVVESTSQGHFIGRSKGVVTVVIWSHNGKTVAVTVKVS